MISCNMQNYSYFPVTKGINGEMRLEPGSSNSKSSVLISVPSLLSGCSGVRAYQKGNENYKKHRAKSNPFSVLTY